MRKSMPVSRLFGMSEIWRQDGTGTREFHILGFAVWRKDFYHSTLWLD